MDPDHRVITHFLEGRSAALRVGTVPVAWFHEGSIQAQLLAGSSYDPSVGVLHQLLDVLGMLDLRLARRQVMATREPPARPGFDREMRYFFGKTIIEIDSPFLLASPATVAGYRAIQNPHDPA